MERIRSLLTRYKSILLYVFFGALTTLVNFLVYYLCYRSLAVANVPSTIVAWVIAVAFAFFTNKVWVFSSRSFDFKTLLREVPGFFGARLATGLLDVGIMYVAVDLLQKNASFWKLASNVLVIVLNYIVSKFIIFRQKNDEKGSPGERR